MQNLTTLLEDAKSFPQNLDWRNPSYYNRSLHAQLDEHAERLFVDEDACSLDFLELSSRGKGMRFSAPKKTSKTPLINRLSRLFAHLSTD